MSGDSAALGCWGWQSPLSFLGRVVSCLGSALATLSQMVTSGPQDHCASLVVLVQKLFCGQWAMSVALSNFKTTQEALFQYH